MFPRRKEPPVPKKEKESADSNKIVAERGEKDGERTKRGGWSETEMKGRNRGKGK